MPDIAARGFAQQTLGGQPVAPALDQHVGYHPGLIDRTPEPLLHPGDLSRNLIQVPLVSGTGQLLRIRLANAWPHFNAQCHMVS